jgi:hypothetical protein
MKDTYCSYKLVKLLEKVGFDFSSSTKVVNSHNEVLPDMILGYASACDGTEEPTSTLQSVRSWLVDRGFRIEVHFSIPRETYTSTIIRRIEGGFTTEQRMEEIGDYDDCLEKTIIYVLQCYFLE